MKKYIPREIYPNKLLVKGYPENVAGEELLSYLKNRARVDVTGVLFSARSNDTAIIIFDDRIGV